MRGAQWLSGSESRSEAMKPRKAPRKYRQNSKRVHKRSEGMSDRHNGTDHVQGYERAEGS